MNQKYYKYALRFVSVTTATFLLSGVSLFGQTTDNKSGERQNQQTEDQNKKQQTEDQNKKQQNDDQNRQVSDSEIRDAVERKLLWDTSVLADDINVAVLQGVVTLSGEVRNFAEKTRATVISKSRKGVRAVVNNIEVQPGEVTDEDLRSMAQQAFAADQVTANEDIKVDVEDGKVTLSGEVKAWGVKQLAEEVLTDVSGVQNIENNIDVNWEEDRSDEAIKAHVERRFHTDFWIDGQDIDVSVAEGAVTLKGTVDSADEKDRAISQAWVTGVTSVVPKNLNVRDWSKDDSSQKKEKSQLSDSDIKSAIEDAFLYDPRVFSANPEIEVEDGHVTLSGTVGTLSAKLAAIRDAENTVGVTNVTDQLSIETAQNSDDATLERNLEAAFRRSATVESYEIETSVKDRNATLSGDVDSYFEKVRAESIAAGIPGIKDVENEIEIDSTDYGYTYYPYYTTFPYDYDYWMDEVDRMIKEDKEIKEDMESEMWWSWFIDGDDVNVKVQDGIVTLTGTVPNAGDKDTAEKNAWDAGATGVVNKLQVES